MGRADPMTAHNKDDTGTLPGLSGPVPPVALWIGGGCVLVELVLLVADLGLVGSPLWRSLAYQNGAFWPGLLWGWQPNYAAQPALMFVSYAFLHSGVWHLLGNMLALVVLARIAADHVGQRAFALIYGVSALGGAAVFGVLALGPQPMVGASGALFGLAGAWQYWEYAHAGRGHRRGWHLARAFGSLVMLNLALWVAFSGALAWQTHLGGFLAGWMMASLLHRRRAGRPDQ